MSSEIRTEKRSLQYPSKYTDDISLMMIKNIGQPYLSGVRDTGRG